MTRDEQRYQRFRRFEEWEARQAAPAPERTIGVLWDEWVATLTGLRRRHAAGWAKHVFRGFKHRGEELVMAELTPAGCSPPVLQSWVASVAATQSRNGTGLIVPGSVDQIRMGVQSMFKHHVRLGELAVNPLRALPRDPRRDRKRQGYYTVEEIERFAAAMPQVGGWILRHCFRTCCRKDNIRLLRKDQIDWAQRELVLTAKGGKQLRVAVPDDTLEEMRALCAVAPGRYVYPSPLRPMEPVPEHTLQGWVRRARKTTGLVLPGGEAPNIHHSRHGGAVALLDAGADITEVQAQLGHSDIGQTARYLAMRDRRRERLREKLNAVGRKRP